MGPVENGSDFSDWGWSIIMVISPLISRFTSMVGASYVFGKISPPNHFLDFLFQVPTFIGDMSYVSMKLTELALISFGFVAPWFHLNMYGYKAVDCSTIRTINSTRRYKTNKRN